MPLLQLNVFFISFKQCHTETNRVLSISGHESGVGDWFDINFLIPRICKTFEFWKYFLASPVNCWVLKIGRTDRIKARSVCRSKYLLKIQKFSEKLYLGNQPNYASKLTLNKMSQIVFGNSKISQILRIKAESRQIWISKNCSEFCGSCLEEDFFSRICWPFM